MGDGIRVETVHNTQQGDAKPLRIDVTADSPALKRRGGGSRPMVFGMRKSTTAILAILMAVIFTLQVLALSGGQEGAARLLTILIAAGSGVLALLYFVVSITRTTPRDAA
jgi:hypothetical protein